MRWVIGGKTTVQQTPFSQQSQNTFGFQSMPGTDPDQVVKDYQNFSIATDPGSEQRKALRDQATENSWNNDFTSGIPAQLRIALQNQDRRANQQMSDYERQNAQYSQNSMELARKQSLLPQLVQTGGSSSGYNSQVIQKPSVWNSILQGAATVGGAAIMASDPRLKNIEGKSDAGLNEVKRLHPIVYKYKEGTGLDNEQHEGLNAKEVEKAMPDAVSRIPHTEPDADDMGGPSDGDADNYYHSVLKDQRDADMSKDNTPMRAIHMEKVQSALINSVKELSDKVDAVAGKSKGHVRPKIRRVK